MYHSKYLKYKNKYIDLKGGRCRDRITISYFTEEFDDEGTSKKVENKLKWKYNKDDYISYFVDDKYNIFGHIVEISGTDIVLKQHQENGTEETYKLSTHIDDTFTLSIFRKENDSSMDLNQKIKYLKLENGAEYMSGEQKYSYLKIKYDNKIYFGRIYENNKKLVLVYIYNQNDDIDKFIVLNDIEKIQEISFYNQINIIFENKV